MERRMRATIFIPALLLLGLGAAGARAGLPGESGHTPLPAAQAQLSEPARTSIASRSLRLRGVYVAVWLRCAGDTCAGTLGLRSAGVVRGRRVDFGRQVFRIFPGRSRAVKVRVARERRDLLRRVRRIRVEVSVTTKGALPPTVRRTLTLKV
jgi:hypothetical protein